MKVFLLIASLFMAFYANTPLSAQLAPSKGSCSIFLCEGVTENEDGNTNLKGVFTGFSSNAVGKKVNFIVYTRFQDFALNVAHVRQLKLISPEGENILDINPGSFILASKTATHSSRSNLELVFPTVGVYQFQVLVDDVIVEYLNLKVGD